MHAHTHARTHYSDDPRDSRLYSLIITFFCRGPPHLHLTTCHSSLPCSNNWNHAVITLVVWLHWLHPALSQGPLNTYTYILIDRGKPCWILFLVYFLQPPSTSLFFFSLFLFLSYCVASSPPRKRLCLWARAAAVCGPGPAVLGGAGAEEMGCARTDRWQSHLLTVQRCGTVRGGEERGKDRGRGGGRQ